MKLSASVKSPVKSINTYLPFSSKQRSQHPLLFFPFFANLRHPYFRIPLLQSTWWLRFTLKLHDFLLCSCSKRITAPALSYGDCTWRQQSWCITCVVDCLHKSSLPHWAARQANKESLFSCVRWTSTPSIIMMSLVSLQFSPSSYPFTSTTSVPYNNYTSSTIYLRPFETWLCLASML